MRPGMCAAWLSRPRVWHTLPAVGSMDFGKMAEPVGVAAGILLIEEAGGRVTNYQNAPLDITLQKSWPANGLLHEAMMNVLIVIYRAGSDSDALRKRGHSVAGLVECGRYRSRFCRSHASTTARLNDRGQVLTLAQARASFHRLWCGEKGDDKLFDFPQTGTKAFPRPDALSTANRDGRIGTRASRAIRTAPALNLIIEPSG